jgi:hypothetical protein
MPLPTTLLLLAAPVLAGDLYVDSVVGSDTNSGLLPTQPLATISQALSLAGAGTLADPDHIHLAPGVYAGAETFPLELGRYQTLTGGGRDVP